MKVSDEVVEVVVKAMHSRCSPPDRAPLVEVLTWEPPSLDDLAIAAISAAYPLIRAAVLAEVKAAVQGLEVDDDESEGLGYPIGYSDGLDAAEHAITTLENPND